MKVRVLLWRFFTGNHLDGRPRTNATWLRPGTLPKHKANWWNRKPRIHRAGFRYVLLAIVAAEYWLWEFHFTAACVLNLAAAPFLLSRIQREIRHHFRIARRVSVKERRLPRVKEQAIIDAIGTENEGPVTEASVTEIFPEAK